MSRSKTKPPVEFEEVDIDSYALTKVPKPRPTAIVLEMRARAADKGLLPHELLYWIASDPDAEFTDYIVDPVTRGLIEIKRKATLKERVDCAKHSAQYYASPKAQQINQNNTIRIEHSLPATALDSTVLDDLGRVIENDDIDLDE